MTCAEMRAGGSKHTREISIEQLQAGGQAKPMIFHESLSGPRISKIYCE